MAHSGPSGPMGSEADPPGQPPSEKEGIVLVTVCAWHNGTEGVEFSAEFSGRTAITHGICIVCRAKALAELPSPPPGVALRMVEDAERE